MIRPNLTPVYGALLAGLLAGCADKWAEMPGGVSPPPKGAVPCSGPAGTQCDLPPLVVNATEGGGCSISVGFDPVVTYAAHPSVVVVWSMNTPGYEFAQTTGIDIARNGRGSFENLGFGVQPRSGVDRQKFRWRNTAKPTPSNGLKYTINVVDTKSGQICGTLDPLIQNN